MTDSPMPVVGSDALGISLARSVTLIDEALDNWKNQTLISQSAVIDLLLDIRGQLS